MKRTHVRLIPVDLPGGYGSVVTRRIPDTPPAVPGDAIRAPEEKGWAARIF